MTHAILWELTGRRGHARAFLVAGDVLIAFIQDLGQMEVEARPVMAATHEAAVWMALDMTAKAERDGLVLSTKPRTVEIPDFEPAHLYSAQALAGFSVAPRVDAILDRMIREGVPLDELDAGEES